MVNEDVDADEDVDEMLIIETTSYAGVKLMKC